MKQDTTVQLETIFEQIIDGFRDMDNQKMERLNSIKDNLNGKYDVPQGVVESLLTRETADIFGEEDVRLIGLFVKEALELDRQSEMVNQLFTEPEIKEMEQYLYRQEAVSTQLPLDLFPALKLNDITHSVKMSATMVAQLVENQVLNYNYDIQREAKSTKRKDEIIKTPRINQKNIDEMTELLLKGQLKDSTIYFNAAPRTADEGDELIMDEKNHKLFITKGSRLDILDGFHRCLASQKAHSINPNIDFNFNVVVSNYTTKEAQTWQAQHAKAMPWSTHRVKELQKENRSDKVVAALRANPDIGEYISASTKSKRHQITNFTVLSEAIDRYFKIENRRDEVDAVELLSNYFDELSQYDIDWERPRRDNMFTSSSGMTGIVYYISKHQGEPDVNEFYGFLDRYRERENDMKEKLQSDSLNLGKVTSVKADVIEKIVEECRR